MTRISSPQRYRVWLFLIFFLGASLPISAALKTKVVDYKVGETALQGYMAWDDSIEGPRPGVLVVHEWWGHNDYARKRAEKLAEAGFTAFALDMYGTGKLADHPEDAQAFMMELMGDIPEAQRRFEAAHSLLQDHATVDGDRTAAIGYCLGGAVVLYMGRLGGDLDAVISYHGSLGLATQVTETEEGAELASMMVFTGGDDPMVPGEQVGAFVSAMMAANVNVNVTSYPGVLHSFTVPEATEKGKKLDMPFAYDAAADADSWRRSLAFLHAELGSTP
ncbi:MAG: dienelactone hydrolase family protein [Acidobacteriota bacterium]